MNRRTRLALLVSGLRWRARSSLAMLAVAVFATGAAAFGPVYLHSTDQVVLDGTLGHAAPGNAGLTIRPVLHRRTLAWISSFARSAPEPGGATRWWGQPILTETAGFETVPLVAPKPGAASLATPTGTGLGARTPGRVRLVKIPKEPYRGTRPFVGSIVARSGVCAHLDMVQGTCPHGLGVVVSTRTSQTLGLVLGGSLHVVFIKTSGAVVTMPIVGIYLPGPPFAPYWWEQNYFGFGSAAAGQTAVTNIDAVFATAAGMEHWAPHTKITVMAQVPYRRGTLSVDSVGALRADLAAFEESAFERHGVRVTTTLGRLLDEAASTEHAAATVVDIAGLELVLLGVLVLYFVASRTSAEREPDVRLAELRGFRSRSTIAVALAEPLAVVGAAVPVGLLGAWAVATLTAPAIFGSGIGVSVTVLSVVAAVVAGIVGLGAAALGARRSLSGQLGAAGDPSQTDGGPSRWGILGDAAIVALAAAAFVELVVTGDSGSGPSGTNPLAAFAPALLAVGLGVLVARALPWSLRFLHSRTAFSPNVAAALATRTVARRREYRTQLVLASLAVALATFAVSGWVIAGRNRDQRATLGVGAAKVLTVGVKSGTTFVKDVRAATPTGGQAMAVVVEHASDGTTLAVDASRLAAVATWPGSLGIGARAVARRLEPGRLAPVVPVTGSEIALDAVAAGVPTPRPQLAVDVYDVDTQFSTRIALGRLQPGAHRYTGRLFAACPGGCRLLDIALTWSPTAAESRVPGPGPRTSVAISSIEVHTKRGSWAELPAALRDPKRWSSLQGGARLRAGGGGLVATFSLSRFGTPTTIGPADVPRALPVVVTPESDSTASGFGGPLVVGLDGSTLPGRAVASVPSLPGVGAGAVLTDLPTAERYLFTTFHSAVTQVWLAPTAPSGVIARLRAHGVEVLSTSTAAAAVAALGHSGLNLAYLLYLVAAIASAVLVVGATAFALSVAARRRQAELAALRAVGVDGRALRSAVRLEQAIVVGAGLLTGAVAGTVAAAVALRSVPEFVLTTAGPPLQLGLPAGALALALGAVVLALVITVGIGSAVVVRGATVDRLAGGPS